MKKPSIKTLKELKNSDYKSQTIKDELCKKLIEFKKLNDATILEKKILAKKKCSNFTMFNHYKKLNKT